MNKLTIAVLSLCPLASVSYGQTTTTNTTLATSMTRGDQTINLTSSTGVLAAVVAPVTGLYVDREYMTVLSNVNTATGTGNVWNVKRGVAGIQAAHNAGAVVWVGPPGVFDLAPNDRSGACTASTFALLPLIQVRSGNLMTCDGNGKFSPYGIGSFYVPPTQCTFAPTTLTQTTTYPAIGASNLFVANSVTNAAAGTDTLTCNILVPTAVLALRGAVITDITLFVGSQVVAPTSLGTATLAAVTFPAAATTEVASTVTPVAIGGAVTTVSPALITTVTTAGSFLTIKHTFATVVDLSTDLRVLQYTMPFVQAAASAMTLNTPGMLIHYRAAL